MNTRHKHWSPVEACVSKTKKNHRNCTLHFFVAGDSTIPWAGKAMRAHVTEGVVLMTSLSLRLPATMLHGAEPPEFSILMPASDRLGYPRACAGANGFPLHIQAALLPRHRNSNQPAHAPLALERESFPAKAFGDREAFLTHLTRGAS
ncbi:hypothetical protein M3J09_007823 [Ascochyta lentis]